MWAYHTRERELLLDADEVTSPPWTTQIGRAAESLSTLLSMKSASEGSDDRDGAAAVTASRHLHLGTIGRVGLYR
jgi:hypothetical protein